MYALIDAVFCLVSPPENNSFRKDLCFSQDVFFSEREISLSLSLSLSGLHYTVWLSTTLLVGLSFFISAANSKTGCRQKTEIDTNVLHRRNNRRTSFQL